METGEQMIEVEAVWKLIDETVVPGEACEVPVAGALGTVAAADVVAPADMPAFDHSAMDGYALADSGLEPCTIVREVAAGSVDAGVIQSGQAVRIFTGAPLPRGTRCVVRQEDCLVDGSVVRVREDVIAREGDHLRRRGELLKMGGVILPAWADITAGAIALLASCGITRVPAIPHPVTCHISTGSELVEAGGALGAGQIYDSNGPMMQALLDARGIRLVRRRVPDVASELHSAVAEFAGGLLLISGGSGPGDHDHTGRALRDAGYTVHASRINSRPGRPLIFATRGRQVAFGLPGNPLSHWVCFHAFVTRALARLEGRDIPALINARLAGQLPGAGDGRRTWTPARRQYREGMLYVEPLGWQHSGDLTPLASADALLMDRQDPATHLIPTFLL